LPCDDDEMLSSSSSSSDEDYMPSFPSEEEASTEDDQLLARDDDDDVWLAHKRGDMYDAADLAFLPSARSATLMATLDPRAAARGWALGDADVVRVAAMGDAAGSALRAATMMDGEEAERTNPNDRAAREVLVELAPAAAALAADRAVGGVDVSVDVAHDVSLEPRAGGGLSMRHTWTVSAAADVAPRTSDAASLEDDAALARVAAGLQRMEDALAPLARGAPASGQLAALAHGAGGAAASQLSARMRAQRATQQAQPLGSDAGATYGFGGEDDDAFLTAFDSDGVLLARAMSELHALDLLGSTTTERLAGMGVLIVLWVFVVRAMRCDAGGVFVARAGGASLTERLLSAPQGVLIGRVLYGREEEEEYMEEEDEGHAGAKKDCAAAATQCCSGGDEEEPAPACGDTGAPKHAAPDAGGAYHALPCSAA
jgi:hypothetical protein